jgi:hypothetical protein
MQIFDPAYRLAKRPDTDNFGLVEIDAERGVSYLDSAVHVRRILETAVMPATEEEGHRSCIRMSRLLGSISSQANASWFRISEMLGHPAPELAGSMLSGVQELGRAIKKRKSGQFMNAIHQLRNNMCLDVLDSYIDVAGGGADPTKEVDWAYIIGLPDHRTPLQIGACQGDVLDVVADLNRRNAGGEQVFGILAAWLVHDPDEVAEGIRMALQDSEVMDDLYEINLGTAKLSVETFLKETDNFVMSPWHVEDDDIPLAIAG